jgi:hypothetical protein
MMAFQENVKAILEEMEAVEEASLEEMKARMDVFEGELGRMDATRKACLERMEANVETSQKSREAESMTDLENVCLGVEVNREKSEAVVEHQEVPKEEATVEAIGALEDQYGDQHLAKGHGQHPKKQIQGNGGSWKKLAAACRWMTCCTISAWHEGHGCQRPGRDSVARGAPEG